jgi:hypothetical protein
MRTCVVLGADAERVAATIPRDLYSVTTDRAAVPTADVLVIDDVWFSRLRPLDGMADDEAILRYLRQRGILDFTDLERLNLEELATAPGVARQPLQRFVRALSRSGRHPAPDRLQEFVIRRGIFT